MEDEHPSTAPPPPPSPPVGAESASASSWLPLTSDAAAAEQRPIHLLIIDYSIDWSPFFAHQRIGQRRLRVFQSQWSDVGLDVDGRGVCWARVGSLGETVPLDAVLVRNFPTDVHRDYERCVLALAMSNVVCVNSAESLLQCMSRATCLAALMRLRRTHGVPSVQARYFSNDGPRGGGSVPSLSPDTFPVVIKCGDCHAGAGKALCRSADDLADLQSIMLVNPSYWTMEPFVEHEYEFRLQKIGSHYRAFRRNSDTSWKNNTGNLSFSPHEWQPVYTEWVEAVATLFGGLDIVALDVLHGVDGSDTIIEFNASACGLWYDYESEDMTHIRNLMLDKIRQRFDSQ